MIEAETLAILQDKIYALSNTLAAIEEERSNTPLIISIPEPLDSYIGIPPALCQSPASLKEPKITKPSTFDEKAPEFSTFLQQCKLYICIKPITF